MLVLARKTGQSIVINDNVEILVIEVRATRFASASRRQEIPVPEGALEQINTENKKGCMRR